MSGSPGTAMARLAASAIPAEISICPQLKADLVTARRRTAWARIVAAASVPRVSSGGTSRARMTKKPSSRWKASDSPPRNTTTGHTQLPITRAPIVTATTH